jgi:hypothetical protein
MVRRASACAGACAIFLAAALAAGEHAKVDLGVGASFHGERVFPDDNPWNTPIDDRPVDPNSAALIASIGADRSLHNDFGTVWNGVPNGIPYVVVDGHQAKVPIKFTAYGDESEPGPYPVPPNALVEGGVDRKNDGDRHVLVVDRDNWELYELFRAFPQPDGSWHAESGAIFDLGSNALRPAGWTSCDAAGLPIFPGLVRYDEVMEQGEIRHAIRFTVQRSRRAYVPPARHWASRSQDPNLPPMGMRLRLKKNVDISRLAPPARVIALALKRYGLIVADNGSNWYLNGAPDPRWNDDDLGTIRGLHGRDFEVVRMDGLVSD